MPLVSQYIKCRKAMSVIRPLSPDSFLSLSVAGLFSFDLSHFEALLFLFPLSLSVSSFITFSIVHSFPVLLTLQLVCTCLLSEKKKAFPFFFTFPPNL